MDFKDIINQNFISYAVTYTVNYFEIYFVDSSLYIYRDFVSTSIIFVFALKLLLVNMPHIRRALFAIVITNVTKRRETAIISISNTTKP